ncbi:MAG: dihydroorotase [Acaryochloridaceae cyanobacterium CSU_5_19]|nr:dihydroorotase [Acaryochloridaceae cyanobacterium CSU_5_19]
MTQELLRQVRLLDPISQVDRVGDLLIGEGQILEVSAHIDPSPPNINSRDCTGLVLAPGLVDLYSHADEPGFETRETLASLAAAAVGGGFTRLMLLPDTQPVLDHGNGIAWLQAHLPQGLPLQVKAWGAISQNLEGQQLVEFSDLVQAGVVGFSDGRPLQNLLLLRRFLEYLGPQAPPIALWPCQVSLAEQGVIREGLEALRLGLPEISTLAETTALATLIEMVALVKTPIHIMRVSTARSVALLKAAKAEGLPITASTTWMHLLGNSQSLGNYDVNWRLDPPVGTVADQEALISGIETGVIDAISIDHHAYTYEEKTVAFSEAPPGAIGLELALPLLWDSFVNSGRWSALTLWRALSTQPSQCLHQVPAVLQAGHPAELVLFDPQQTWQIDPQSLHSLSYNTPWQGQTLRGRVLKTWCPIPSMDPLK